MTDPEEELLYEANGLLVFVVTADSVGVHK